MTFRSKTQPFCRWCGKKIAKYTVSHRTPKTSYKFDENELVTLADVRKLTNEQIVSVKYHYEEEHYEDLTPGELYAKKWKRHANGRRSVYIYSTWDGETYVDEFFCNGEHARDFGYAAAAKGFAMPAYNKAVGNVVRTVPNVLKAAGVLK